MWRARREEAEKLKSWHEQRSPGSEFCLKEVPGGRGFEILQVRHCEQCNAEMLTGGGWDKPAICEDCDRKKRRYYLAKSVEEGEARRQSLQRYIDFEEVCQ